jgi:hypothetical protein
MATSKKTLNITEQISQAEKKDPPIFNTSGKTFTEKLKNYITYAYTMFMFFGIGYIKLHKPEFGFLLALMIYIIIINIIFTKNPLEIINPDNGGLSIFIAMLGAFLIVMGYFFYEKKKQLYENESDASTLSFFGKLATSMVSILIMIGIIYFVFNLSAEFSDFTKYFLFGINIVIFFGLISLAMKFFGVTGGEPKDKKASWFGLLMKIITYIPCLIIDLSEYIKYQYQITTKPIVIIFLLELLLIAFYIIFPIIMDKVLYHNAKQLLSEPISISNETNLGTFKDVNFKDDKFQYKYAISSWIYLDSFPPETNSNYDEFTSLLNIGNKPNILFNMLKNKLKIMVELQDKTQYILYESLDIKLQKWNHIVINYDGKTTDVFINNILVSTNPGVIPYNDNTQLTCGQLDGIHGGICNVTYFNDNISRGKINTLYNSVNNLNPPII